ncbi:MULTISPECIES: hypothetical protein [Vibrio harveyi group]|uniref:Uncharacterized protein n=1 Tax=Vibrio campbellii TaxID=680 RepID=A0AAQ2Y5N8_9VIBR|nr:MULTISPECIES: hypothetical protein [Vibrio harveyi group]EDL68394.1 hypothetical protein A1Q_5001 [Vibrio campbellii HY01]EHE7894255.1 hypothetical protein [Vibrio parahaemolyticus]EJE4227729.1 hypothetical protein [Vibrio parahaemolyticus]EKI0734756.1 hypothetical protein [Vibrio parahaemolyticus]MBE4144358.1 hypothetical protein [Vibrio parahaemolyticus]
MDLVKKKQLISDMNDAYSKLNYIVVDLYTVLEDAKKEQGADKAKKMAQAKQDLITVKGKRTELGSAIDELIASTMRDWLLDAKTITAGIKTSTSKLNQIEKNIEQRNQVADNVIGVLGVVDDLVSLIAKIV